MASESRGGHGRGRSAALGRAVISVPLVLPFAAAAEKYVKAFLTRHQVEFPKTHVFGKLLDLMGRVDEALAASISGATALNPYGVELRYPSDIPEPTRLQAEEALHMARSVRDAVLNALPSLDEPPPS